MGYPSLLSHESFRRAILPAIYTLMLSVQFHLVDAYAAKFVHGNIVEIREP